MSKKVLITGSTGMIGKQLKSLLLEQGYSIHELSRRKLEREDTYQWDISDGFIEPGALDGVTSLVHLAGAGVADERWTEKRKKELFDSRIDSTRLLYDQLKNNPDHTIKTFICASAIGYYGFDRGDELVNEESSPGKDFLAKITREWEVEARKFEELGIRVVSIRIGIVLSRDGGALAEIIKPVQWMAGAALGSGKQYMSWIHIKDIVGIIAYALNTESISGVYNGVAPQPETNKQLTKTLASVMKKPFFLPPVPSFVLKLALGEMSVLVLGGLKVSSQKIISEGYSFMYSELQPALKDLMDK